MRLFRWIFVVSLLLVSSGVRAQTRLTRNGKPAARIVVAQQTAADLTAAQLLQRFVRESTGATLPLLHDVTPRKGNILIGASDTAGLAEDGFRLRTQDGVLRISSGGDKGAVYGVMTLLERYLGLDYFAAGVYDLDRNPTVTLPAMDFAENPAFRYRQSQGYGMAQDSVYRLALRLEEPRDIFAGGLWVHTFNSLLPASVYGAEHPEYYSFINGERRPGRASQWCLTNDELFELVAAKVDSIFRANPGMNIISISQNDSNFTYCRCEECEKVNRHEGALSGNYVRFLNKLAERFPDKEFSTLAYLFTMQPPKHVKPLPNVNIMLCDIDCDREVPLTDNASGREFIEAMEGWAALSDNIFVWDYGINFDNMVAPFPNFPILKPNIGLFRRNHATMHFSQIGGSYGGDFSEMRTYVVAKLMWNPDQDTDSLMLRFMRGYYGPAAPYIYQYEKLLEGALLAGGQRLWIYDSPVSHKDGMLNAACRKRYGELFDCAERAVAGDGRQGPRRRGERAGRVREIRDPIRRENAQRAQQQSAGILPALPQTLPSCGELQSGAGRADRLDRRSCGEIPGVGREDPDRRSFRRRIVRRELDGLGGQGRRLRRRSGPRRDLLDGRDRFPAPAGPVDSAAPFGALLRFVRQRGLDPVRAGGVS